MPRMLKVLSQHPELGCLGFQQWFGRTTLIVQYWRDFDSLDRFARDRDLPSPGAVAAVQPRRPGLRRRRDLAPRYQSGRADARPSTATCPVFGLAAAARHLPAGRKADTAAARIGATTTDEPVVEPY